MNNNQCHTGTFTSSSCRNSAMPKNGLLELMIMLTKMRLETLCQIESKEKKTSTRTSLKTKKSNDM